MSRFFSFLLFLGTGLALIWFWPDKNFRMVVCDVGQGDAILFNYRNYQVLVDGGANDKVLECLNNNIPFWDRDLEMVILTHPDKDHYGGLIYVAERYRLLYFVWGGLMRQDSNFEKLLAQVGNQRSNMIRVEQGSEIAVDKIKIKFYWPNKEWLSEKLSDNNPKEISLNQSESDKEYQKESILGTINEESQLSINDFSLVFNIAFDEFDVLITGDADSRIQPEIMKTAAVVDAEILKVAHHGSRHAFNDRFLSLFESALAIISVGGNNPWGHPSPDLLRKLDRFGLAVLRTDTEGEIKLISDGREWWREE